MLQPRRLRPRDALCAAALALAFGLAPTAAAAQVLPHAPTVDRLPNGLTVVTVPYDAPGIVAYFTLVRTGSRDEVEAGHSGFAHLFEHMMFRGTRALPAREYEHRMQRMGADNNAYTTEDYTLYTVTIPTAALPDLVPVEADRFRNLFYAQPDFQTETRAVFGEYNKNAASPVHQMWETLSELAFTRHTYGHTTMGYLADIQAMPRYYAYSQQFFRRFYTPDNCTVIAAGDVDRQRLLALVTEHYGAWQSHRAAPVIPVEPPQTAARARALAWEGTSPPRVLIGYRAPGFTLQTPDTAALEVVHALTFSESSDLYQRLVVRESKLLGLESWAGDFHRDPGLFVVEAALGEGITHDEVTRAVADELARVGRGEVSPERITEVISHLRYHLPLSVQTPSDAAQTVARFMALTGEPMAFQVYHDRLSNVTPADVARVARTYLTDARRSVVTLAPAASAPAGAVRAGPNSPAPRMRRAQ
jgi:zinc protease